MTIELREAGRSALWVALAWLVGVGVLGAAFALRLRVVQDHGLDLAVLIWLAPLAAYDWRRRAVPHMACVAVPCLAALVHAFTAGVWQLGAVGALALAASERQVVRNAGLERWIFIWALAAACVLALISGEAAPGAIAVVGFWIAYELGWWAGADAVVAITLAVLWPDIRWLAALGAAHIAGAAWLCAWRWRPRNGPKSLTLDPVPGLPVIGLAALLHVGWPLGWPG